MAIHEKNPDYLLKIAGREANIYRQEVTLLLKGSLPAGWSWVPCSKNAVVACKKEPFPVYYKEFLARDKFEKIKSFFRGSRCQRARLQTNFLEKAGLPTPELLCWGTGRKNEFILSRSSEGDGFYFFLKNNFTPPLTLQLLHRKRHLLQQAGKLIGRLHKTGIIHGDLRPNNLLVKEDGKGFHFSFIDNESNQQVRRIPLSLLKKNLVQFSLIPDNLLSRTDLLRLFKAYTSQFKRLSPQKERQLLREIIDERHKRMTRHLMRRKQQQRTKQIKELQNSDYYGECYQGNAIDQALAQGIEPAVWFEHGGKIIKQDGLITAKLMTTNQEEILFAKRFLPKSPLYFLKNLIYGERAQKLWRISHIFQDLGIPVPKPSGYIITGTLPWRRTNYFFSAALPNTTTLLSIAHNKKELSSWLNSTKLLERLAVSLAQIHNFGYTHGDTKWANILVNQETEEFWWIDLDDAKQQIGLFQRQTFKDVARFAVDIIESGLDSEFFNVFLTRYAHSRWMRPKDLERKILPFIKKIVKRHKSNATKK